MELYMKNRQRFLNLGLLTLFACGSGTVSKHEDIWVGNYSLAYSKEEEYCYDKLISAKDQVAIGKLVIGSDPGKYILLDGKYYGVGIWQERKLLGTIETSQELSDDHMNPIIQHTHRSIQMEDSGLFSVTFTQSLETPDGQQFGTGCTSTTYKNIGTIKRVDSKNRSCKALSPACDL